MSTPYGSDRPGEGRPGEGAADNPTQPAQQGYAGAGYDPVPTKPKNGMGTAALVLGILAVLSLSIVWVPFLGILTIVLGLIAIILGALGRGRVRKGRATNGGAALTGLILGVLTLLAGIIVQIIVIIAAVAFLNSGGAETLQQAGDCFSAAQSQPSPAAVQQAVQQCSQQFGQQLPQFGGQ